MKTIDADVILARATPAAHQQGPEMQPFNTRDVRPGARLSPLAPGRNHDAGRLDAVAGCEFLDDRIRLLE